MDAVGAVPGPVASSASAGCHRLPREYDAVCVTTADEMAELAPIEREPRDDEQSAEHSTGGPVDPAGTRIRLLDALAQRSPRSPEKIAAISGLAVDRVRAELGLLAVEGLVRERAGGWVTSAEPSSRSRRPQ